MNPFGLEIAKKARGSRPAGCGLSNLDYQQPASAGGNRRQSFGGSPLYAVITVVLVLAWAGSNLMQGATISIADSNAYVHGGGSLIAKLDSTSAGYFSTLDESNAGTFGWTFTNTTGSAIGNFEMFGFLDADIDRDLNSFFNEYGEFVGLSLPPGAPGGSLAASGWQIDEPGFTFGTILTDLAAGTLKNTNFVPSSAPDDVSLALGYAFGDLPQGQTATIALQISTANIGGLHQVDPDSSFDFYLNGFATVGSVPPSAVPEPSGFVLIGTGVLLILLRRR